jgi:hypothetical protein
MREESLKKRELVQYYFFMAMLRQNAIYIYIYRVVSSKTFSCFPFIPRGNNRNIKRTVLTYMDL